MVRPNDNLVVGTRMLYEKNRREDGGGRDIQISTCHLRVRAGRRGALHKGVLIHSSNSVNPDTLATVAAKDEELRNFDTEQAFSEASVDEEIYIKILEKNPKFTGAVGLLNMIYGLIQVEICWFNIFHYNRMAIGFEQ